MNAGRIRGFIPEVNVMAQLECELSYYASAVKRFNHYTTTILLRSFGLDSLFNGLSSFVGYSMPNPSL